MASRHISTRSSYEASALANGCLKVGTRWFMTPGAIGSAGGGAAVLDDTAEEIVATVYGADGSCTMTEPIAIVRATKMKIQGGG